MAHILVGGDHGKGQEVHQLLRQWGHTSSRFSAVSRGTEYPTIDQCDALILVSPENDLPLPELRSSDQSSFAPLLLLGTDTGSLLLSRGAQQEVNQPDPQGVDLKFALQSCLEKSRQLRGEDHPANQAKDRSGYQYFLGHELRSPLTATKTALEVLQGELGEMLGWQENGESPSSESEILSGKDHPGLNQVSFDPQLKMLDIALRNIKRLHRTVDWSQDLQELEASIPAGQWSQVSVSELGEMLPRGVDLELDPGLEGRQLKTDASLLRLLVGQVVRVLDYARPGCRFRCAASLDPKLERHLRVYLLAAAEDENDQTQRITRTHLTPTASGSEGSQKNELERLVQYVVSGPLLDQLQVGVEVVEWEEVGAGLVLDLVLTGQDATGEEFSDNEPRALHTLA